MLKFLGFASVLLFGCSISRPLVDKEKVAGRYDKICLEGHVYYSALSSQSHDWRDIETIAPKFDDDGKPAKCPVTSVNQ